MVQQQMDSSVDTQLNKPLYKNGSLHKAQQTESYELLVESIQDYAIFLLDTGGHVISWNAGAQKLKGYKANEIIGKHFSKFYPQKDIKAGKPAAELLEARQNGRVEDEGWRIKKDGSKFWANVIITALFDNSGKLQGYAKVTRDLTKRKRQEEQLKKINLTLRRQQKELRKLNSAKDEFISLASHQLRTPAKSKS
jgi:PAS domain S-box-containing protein